MYHSVSLKGDCMRQVVLLLNLAISFLSVSCSLFGPSITPPVSIGVQGVTSLFAVDAGARSLVAGSRSASTEGVADLYGVDNANLVQKLAFTDKDGNVFVPVVHDSFSVKNFDDSALYRLVQIGISGGNVATGEVDIAGLYLANLTSGDLTRLDQSTSNHVEQAVIRNGSLVWFTETTTSSTTRTIHQFVFSTGVATEIVSFSDYWLNCMVPLGNGFLLVSSRNSERQNSGTRKGEFGMSRRPLISITVISKVERQETSISVLR